MTQVVGLVLVRNEDVFVEQAIRNVSEFCDRIYVVDHMSDDRTWEIVSSLAREFDHIDVRRSRNAANAHRLVAPYAGTRTWVIGVDGDELYDPTALARFRRDLLDGAHADVFRLKAHVLNCDELDVGADTASGWLAPPSRPVTKLFNFAALERWAGAAERLHEGDTVFRLGYDWDSLRYLSETYAWEDDPLRCLHVCFVRRSTRDGGAERLNLNETGLYDRTLAGAVRRRLGSAAVPRRVAELRRAGGNWKREWYTRGPRLTVDATPFLH
jgi:glycosyltransferase involved in cell wall biosynthesis